MLKSKEQLDKDYKIKSRVSKNKLGLKERNLEIKIDCLLPINPKVIDKETL